MEIKIGSLFKVFVASLLRTKSKIVWLKKSEPKQLAKLANDESET